MSRVSMLLGLLGLTLGLGPVACGGNATSDPAENGSGGGGGGGSTGAGADGGSAAGTQLPPGSAGTPTDNPGGSGVGGALPPEASCPAKSPLPACDTSCDGIEYGAPCNLPASAPCSGNKSCVDGVMTSGYGECVRCWESYERQEMFGLRQRVETCDSNPEYRFEIAGDGEIQRFTEGGLDSKGAAAAYPTLEQWGCGGFSFKACTDSGKRCLSLGDSLGDGSSGHYVDRAGLTWKVQSGLTTPSTEAGRTFADYDLTLVNEQGVSRSLRVKVVVCGAYMPLTC